MTQQTESSLAKAYLAASEHDQGSTLWMQSNIMDHLWHENISPEDFWREVKWQRYAEPGSKHGWDELETEV